MPFKEITTRNFLGRNNEIEGLQGIAAEAAFGDANSIIIYGERGTGKTELLKQLHNRLFNQQNDAVPFFYTVKTPFVSLEDFSRDYLSSFILQSLAFLDKNISLVHTGLYSLDDLIYIAHKSDAQWAVEIIDKYLLLKEEDKALRMFSHAISAPYLSYKKTGRAVVVLMDDFHKIRKFCELNLEGGGSSLWILLESAASSHHTPHIIAGCKPELQKMFFEESSIGNSFELMSLKELALHESVMLMNLLGEIHNVKIDLDLSGHINVLGGNPFYMKSFMQAARQSCRTMSEEGFWQVYLNEVIKGKIHTYWTSLLKSYVPQFEMRKPCLNFMFNLCGHERNSTDFSAIAEKLAIKSGDLDHIINMLQAAGAIETGFSTFGIPDDEVLIDVVKALYYHEIEGLPLTRIRDLILEGRNRDQKPDAEPSFDVSIPAVPKAELVAVKSLEQAAQFYKIPLDAVAQLQMAMVELFASMIHHVSSSDSYSIKFKFRENVFSIEITTGQIDSSFIESDDARFKAYLSDIQVEKTISGTRIVLIKKIRGGRVTAS